MDAIELNAALYAKMEEELTDFANWLLKQPPEVILNHAIEYATKFDIVSIMETTDLSEEKARALLSLEEPLDAIYKDYGESSSNSLDVLVSFIKDKADELLSANQANAAVQVYPYSGEVAEREGDLEWYRQSHKLNIACKNEIEGAIARNYENNTLSDEAVHQVVAQFGLPRTAFVLVNTIREKDWDGRISHDNKAWAKRVPVYPDVDAFGQNKRLKYVVDCNAGLTDIFVNILRREYRQQEQSQQVKPSVRDKLEGTAPKKFAENFGEFQRAGALSMDKRSEVIILRVTPEEKALMQKKQELAGITNLSAYIRKIAIDGYVIQLHFPELKEMVSLLRYSSNNLNQLTKRVHETGRIYDADLEDIKQGQERIWDMADTIITKLAKLK